MASDLTELTQQRELVERRLAAQFAVSRVLAEADNLKLASSGVIEAICVALGWELGAIWTLDPSKQTLACVDVWHTRGASFPEFEEVTRQRVFTSGEGLPGRVWKTFKPIWNPNVFEDPGFVRGQAAAAAGLKSALAFPIPSSGTLLGVIEFFSREIREPDEALLRLAAATGDQIGLFIDRRQAEDALRAQNALLEERTLAQQFLIRASAELDASLDFETTLNNVAHLALPYLADWCAISLVERDGSIRRVATGHVDPQKTQLLEEFQRRYTIRPDSPHPVAEVIRTGVSQLNPDVADERMLRVAPDTGHMDMVRELGMASSMIVPLRARGGTIGAISFIRGSSSSHYTQADLQLAEDLARRAALAVDNARLFQAAQEALALRDEFLAAASHDLKGPLATIKGLAQLLVRFVQRDPIDKKRILDGLETIDGSTNKMTSLINQLLDVSRVEMGHPIELDLKTTDLVALAERVIKDQRYAADRHRLGFEADEPKLTGLWDPERIERVLTNLVGNAIKYSPGDSEVRVRLRVAKPTESSAEAVAIEVQDHGDGIPAADMPHIFDHFHRAKNVRDRVRGSGVGLASVKQIVSQHGGQVLVQSEEGKGSTFTVILPFEPPPTEADGA